MSLVTLIRLSKINKFYTENKQKCKINKKNGNGRWRSIKMSSYANEIVCGPIYIKNGIFFNLHVPHIIY